MGQIVNQESRPPVVAAYGAGVNSTAMLVGMVERGEPVDLVVFSDTGGERPETYEYIQTFDGWLRSRGYPGIVTVMKVNRAQEPVTLEELCLANGMLPSLAYGWKSCSLKHKAQPQEKYVNRWQPARAAWSRDEKVIKLIGYDAREERRASPIRAKVDPKYTWRFPLIEWGWARDECLEAIRRAGLPSPGKSSCFFCPAMTKSEIVRLGLEHPDLLQRALDMEDNARPNLTSVRGLGRRFSWREFSAEQGLLDGDGRIRADARGRVALPVISEQDTDAIPCECYDGRPVAEARPEKAAGSSQAQFIVRRWNKFLSRYIYGTGSDGCHRWSWEEADAKRFDSEGKAREWLASTQASVVRV